MLLIAGLGNPGKKYDGTRHNMGFEVIDLLAKRHAAVLRTGHFQSAIARTVLFGETVILAEPQTYMNLSGQAIRAMVDYYKLDPTSELLVISDDVDLDPGRIRIRKKGSAGGQNGLKNIIACLGTQEFNRIRVGTGHPTGEGEMIEWVLSRFPSEDRKLVDEAIIRAADAAELYVEKGIDQAMNQFNGK